MRPHLFPPRTTEALDPQAVAGMCLSDFFFSDLFRSHSRSPHRSPAHRRSPKPDRVDNLGSTSLKGAQENPPESEVLGAFGLSLHTEERTLRNLCEKYGEVKKVVIIYDRQVIFKEKVSLFFNVDFSLAWIRLYHVCKCRISGSGTGVFIALIQVLSFCVSSSLVQAFGCVSGMFL